MNWETIIQYIEAKESVKRSARRLHDSTQIAQPASTAATSSYYASMKPWSYCANIENNGSLFEERGQKCTAAKHVCKKCNILNHKQSWGGTRTETKVDWPRDNIHTYFTQSDQTPTDHIRSDHTQSEHALTDHIHSDHTQSDHAPKDLYTKSRKIRTSPNMERKALV